MTTIAEENRKALRQSLNVLCGFRETSDEPTSVTAINCDAEFEGLENLSRGMLPVTIMDLAGDGFPNDGGAMPMQTDTDSFRYGYISSEAAQADGSFDNPPGLAISASKNWRYITLELRGQYGDSKTLFFEPIWSSGQTSVYIDSWNPGERVYIVGVFLGKAWIWNNSNLFSVNLDLHSVNTEIGGELEVSSIEIQAYEPTDYTAIIGTIQIGAPIWYMSGYSGDMSDIRNFYLSEPVSWDNNILSIKGQDASMFLDNKTLPVYCESLYSPSADNAIVSRLRAALAPVDYDEYGTVTSIQLSDLIVLYEEMTARSVVSALTGLFRDENGLRMTYVDAGRPSLYLGYDAPEYTIYSDEIAELNTIVEIDKKTLAIVLPEYYSQHTNPIEEVEATSGKTYFVDLDPPVPMGQVNISPPASSETQINCGTIKFKAAATTTYDVYGDQVLSNLADNNNPYKVSKSTAGEEYKFDFALPLFVTDGGDSLTEMALANLLNRSNILYEFTYRGNPHIQPRDVLNVEVATWVDYNETIDGLFPATGLYPATDLYPYGIYKRVRKMIKTWVTMTVDSVSLEHAEGGLTSKIKARKGVV